MYRTVSALAALAMTVGTIAFATPSQAAPAEGSSPSPSTASTPATRL